MKHIIPILLILASCGSAWSSEVTVYVTDYQGKHVVGHEKALGGKTRTSNASLFAAKGEYECFTFALQPKERITDVMVRGGKLTGPGGIIPAANTVVRSIEGGDPKNNTLLLLGKSWDMPGWSKEMFWVTVKVPKTALAGTYRGHVTVTAGDATVARVAVTLEVLPFELQEPSLMVGWHYAWPGSVEMLRKTLKDMREHGCTNVGPLYGWHMPITDNDTTQLNAFMTEYVKAGYTKPVMFAAPMGLTLSGLTGYGPVDSKRFQQKYIEVMKKLHAEMQKHRVPVIFSIGDEFTNKGIRGVKYGAKIARLTAEELPELVTTSDSNGYMEVMAMAPHLNFATFNNGWDGPDNHNRGRRLLNDKFVKEVSKTGAIPYFVNSGKDRFSFGFFLWRMSKYGVRGKVQWFYNLGGKGNEGTSVVRLRGSEIVPTVMYEQTREGIDDLKYLARLERLIVQAKKSGKASDEGKLAEAYLKKLEKSIIPNWTAYSQGGERWPLDGQSELTPKEAEKLGSFNQIRRDIADHIIKMQKAM